MKTKFITLAIATILLSGMVMAATLSRTVPSTVNPGDTFTVTYTASGVPAGKWFVAWEDSVSGGCTPTSGGLPISGFTASEIGESISKTLTAPSSGSCTFTGFYQFTEDAYTEFPAVTVTIEGEPESKLTLYLVFGAIAIVLLLLLKKK